MASAASPDVEIEAANDGSVLRVKSSSSPQAVAGALSQAIYDGQRVRLRAIGAGAVNQAVKACAIARGYVAPRGIDLAFRPGFETIQTAEGEISAVVFYTQVSQ